MRSQTVHHGPNARTPGRPGLHVIMTVRTTLRVMVQYEHVAESVRLRLTDSTGRAFP
jgi:hypothetical protein